MKTLVTLLTIIVFLFIIVRKKLKKSGIGSKKEASEKALLPDKNNQPKTPSDASIDYDICDSNTRHEAHVFDKSECESGSYFAGIIDAKLSIIESEMRDKGYTYKLRFLVLSNCIVCIVEYRLKNVC